MSTWFSLSCITRSMCGHKETSCLPRQSHKSNSTMRLLMNSIERKLLIIENKHVTSAYQTEPAHKPPRFPSRGGALPNFILSHLSPCINKSQRSSYLMENKINLALNVTSNHTLPTQVKSGQFYLYSPESHITMPESALQSVRSETSSVRRPSIPVRKNYPKKNPFNRGKTCMKPFIHSLCSC